MKRRSGIKIVMQLIGLVKPMWLIMTGAVILGVIGYLCATFITILGGYGLLGVLGVQTKMALHTVFIVVAALAVLRGALRYGEQAGNHYIAFRLLALIRDKVFQKLRKLAPAKLEGKDKGNLIAILTSDIELLEVFYAHTISPVCIAVLTCAVMIAFFASYHPALALIALAGYVTVGVILPMITSKMGKEDGNRYRNQFGEINTYFLDSIRGLREVIQYDCGEERLANIDQQSEALTKLQGRLKNCEGKARANCDCAILAFSFLMLMTSVYLFQKGMLNTEGVVISTISMLGSFGPVTALSNLANNLLHTFASGNRVLELLEEEPLIQEVEEKEAEPSFDGFHIKELTFSYKQGEEEEQILSDVSLEIPKNGILGIVGKSGSGKSTLIKLLMRFWDAEKGEISISGKPIKEWSTNGLRALESYVIQDTYLFEDTIENNVKLARLGSTHEQVVEACKKANIHEWIESLPNGYDTVIGEGNHQLSGGERQRIGIARAFLHNSEVIFLDEPTSNLDSLNEAEILKVLKEQQKDKTIILVSHRQSTMKIADCVIRMKEGRAS